MTDLVTGWPVIDSPRTLSGKLAEHGYLASTDLVAAAFLALRMHRPLFLEGDPGVGKTDFAAKIAQALGAGFIRLQCHAGIDASQALYDWNFPRQILALRADGVDAAVDDRERRLRGLYTEEFLQQRPILAALSGDATVLLIDEVDRADDEFEALLLQVLEDYAVDIPEFRRVEARVPPLVVLTSNRTREVHDALKRRCLYHWIGHPSAGLEEEILRRRVPGIPEELARLIAGRMQRVREATKEVTKPPGIAESIDFATALTIAGATELTPDTVGAALSTVVKYHEDAVPVRTLLLVPHQREAA